TAGTGNNFINVASATIPMNIDGNDGGDSINLSNGNLSSISAPISVFGGAGTDAITLRDTSYAFGTTTTMTPTTASRAFFGGLTYGTAEYLTLDAQDVSSDIEVNGTAAAMTVTLNPNGGTDIININETDPTTPVSISNSAGDDTVNINTGGIGSAGALV